MSSTRIRYRMNAEGNLESVKRYTHPTNGSRYKIVINEEKLSYQVIEDMSNEVASEGAACNLHQVKLKAKAKLAGLGIEFEAEGRTKRVAEEATTQGTENA